VSADRPYRRAHDAIAEIHHLATQGYRWVLDADIKACFDSIDHTALMDQVRRRVKDKRVLALVKSFLKAGIMTELGQREESTSGTPQGGILSPLLANIALSVLDEFAEQQWTQTMTTRWKRERRRHQGLGTWRLIRYADLCRGRHKSAYAEYLVMPRLASKWCHGGESRWEARHNARWSEAVEEGQEGVGGAVAAGCAA